MDSKPSSLKSLNIYYTLESYYRKLLRQIQHLPDSTAVEAIYLLHGAIPFQVQHYIRTINYFSNMLRRDRSTERQIILRQLAVNDLTSHSQTIRVRLPCTAICI